MTTFSESEVEEAALEWLEGLGWAVAHGADIAPGTFDAERDNYDQVVLEQRLTDAIARLNPDLPYLARNDALRKLTRPEGATLRNPEPLVPQDARRWREHRVPGTGRLDPGSAGEGGRLR